MASSSSTRIHIVLSKPPPIPIATPRSATDVVASSHQVSPPISNLPIKSPTTLEDEQDKSEQLHQQASVADRTPFEDKPTSMVPLPFHVVQRLREGLVEFPINEECTSLKIAPSGRLVIAGFSDGTLRLFDLIRTSTATLDQIGSTTSTDDETDHEWMERKTSTPLVCSKSFQRYGAVACQIHARGVHTSLLMHVDCAEDGRFCFGGVARGSMELVAVDLTQLTSSDELSHDENEENVLDCIQVHRHSDAKLKGFGACTRLQGSSNSTPTYLLFTGKGIKNIHIWSFTPSTRNLEPQWQCLYDTQTNGNTISLLHFRYDPHGLLQGISKSGDQRLRLWELSYEQHYGDSQHALYHTHSILPQFRESPPPDSRPKRPTFCDVPSTESTVGIAGAFCFGGGYNQMSVVSLDVEHVYNHTELALPGEARGQRRQQRGDLKSLVRVAGMVMDSGHVLLELSDGSVVQYSQHSQNSMSLPRLQVLPATTFHTHATVDSDIQGRKLSLARISSSGMVVAAMSTYCAGRGSIVLRQLEDDSDAKATRPMASTKGLSACLNPRKPRGNPEKARLFESAVTPPQSLPSKHSMSSSSSLSSTSSSSIMMVPSRAHPSSRHVEVHSPIGGITTKPSTPDNHEMNRSLVCLSPDDLSLTRHSGTVSPLGVAVSPEAKGDRPLSDDTRRSKEKTVKKKKGAMIKYLRLSSSPSTSSFTTRDNTEVRLKKHKLTKKLVRKDLRVIPKEEFLAAVESSDTSDKVKEVPFLAIPRVSSMSKDASNSVVPKVESSKHKEVVFRTIPRVPFVSKDTNVDEAKVKEEALIDRPPVTVVAKKKVDSVASKNDLEMAEKEVMLKLSCLSVVTNDRIGSFDPTTDFANAKKKAFIEICRSIANTKNITKAFIPEVDSTKSKDKMSIKIPCIPAVTTNRINSIVPTVASAGSVATVLQEISGIPAISKDRIDNVGKKVDFARPQEATTQTTPSVPSVANNRIKSHPPTVESAKDKVEVLIGVPHALTITTDRIRSVVPIPKEELIRKIPRLQVALNNRSISVDPTVDSINGKEKALIESSRVPIITGYTTDSIIPRIDSVIPKTRVVGNFSPCPDRENDAVPAVESSKSKDAVSRKLLPGPAAAKNTVNDAVPTVKSSKSREAILLGPRVSKDGINDAVPTVESPEPKDAPLLCPAVVKDRVNVAVSTVESSKPKDALLLGAAVTKDRVNDAVSTCQLSKPKESFLRENLLSPPATEDRVNIVDAQIASSEPKEAASRSMLVGPAVAKDSVIVPQVDSATATENLIVAKKVHALKTTVNGTSETRRKNPKPVLAKSGKKATTTESNPPSAKQEVKRKEVRSVLDGKDVIAQRSELFKKVHNKAYKKQLKKSPDGPRKRRGRTSTVHTEGAGDSLHEIAAALCRFKTKSPSPPVTTRTESVIMDEMTEDFVFSHHRRKRPRLLVRDITNVTVKDRLDFESQNGSKTNVRANHEVARMKLAANHRANHEMLRKKVLSSTDYVIKSFTLMPRFKEEDAKTMLSEAVRAYQAILDDMLARQKMEAAALAAEQTLETDGVAVPVLQVSFPFPEVFSLATRSLNQFLLLKE